RSRPMSPAADGFARRAYWRHGFLIVATVTNPATTAAGSAVAAAVVEVVADFAGSLAVRPAVVAAAAGAAIPAIAAPESSPAADHWALAAPPAGQAVQPGQLQEQPHPELPRLASPRYPAAELAVADKPAGLRLGWGSTLHFLTMHFLAL